MGIQGLRNTGVAGSVTDGSSPANGYVAGQRPLNWREGILLYYPNGSTPLTALTAAMKSSATDDPEFNWWEKLVSSQRVPLTSSINTTDTTLAVSAAGTTSSGAKSIPVGALLYAENTGEIMRVTAIGSDTSLTVVRQFNGDKTTGTAITYNGNGVNPYLRVIGTAFEEGSSPPAGLSFDPTKRVNFTQIFRNNIGMTRTGMKTRLRTGDQVREAKRECLELHAMEMEMAFFLGKKSEGTVSGVPLRTTGGIVEWVSTYAASNVVTTYASSALTLANLEDLLVNVFKYGSSEKVCFLGNKAMNILQRTIRLGTNIHYEFSQGQREYGMNITRLMTNNGTLVLKTHPMFNMMSGGTTGNAAYVGMESWMVIVDMNNLKYRYLTDSDTKYMPDQQSNGVDGMQSGYITECGLEIQLPETHFVVKGLSSASAG